MVTGNWYQAVWGWNDILEVTLQWFKVWLEHKNDLNPFETKENAVSSK